MTFNINQCDSYNYSLLIHSIIQGRSPIFIEDLLQKGADVNLWTCNGEQALKHAFFAKKHAKEYMELLLRYGATIDETQIRHPYQLERFRRIIAELSDSK